MIEGLLSETELPQKREGRVFPFFVCLRLPRLFALFLVQSSNFENIFWTRLIERKKNYYIFLSLRGMEFELKDVRENKLRKESKLK